MRLLFWAIAVCLALSLIIWTISSVRQARWAKSHPPIGQFVSVEGNELHFVKIGQGPPLIALHGAGGNLRDFTFSLTSKLAHSYTIYAFDRPAHGYSDIFDPAGETLAEQARIITKAAQTLGIHRATVMGYSFGGTVAMNMALDYPNFVDAMLLIAAPIHTWPDDWVSATYRAAALPIIGPAIMHTAYAILPDSYFRNSYGRVFAPQVAPDGFLEHVGVGLTVHPNRFVVNARQIVPMAPQIKAMIPRYYTLSMPIEIIHGTADKSVSAQYHSADFMGMQPRPNANATYINGMGHGIHQLATDEIISALKRLSK
jgi:pimeloyl-ACP methyl ester carboxylesterase